MPTKSAELVRAENCPEGHDTIECRWDESYFHCPWCGKVESDKEQFGQGDLVDGARVKCADCGKSVVLGRTKPKRAASFTRPKTGSMRE